MTKEKKVITRELIEKLPMDPLVLAVWYMDDGSPRDDCYAARLATQGFSEPECLLLCDYLKKWNINAHVATHLTRKDQFSVVLGADCFGDFVEIIEPIVKQVPCMIYKLNEDRKKNSKKYGTP